MTLAKTNRVLILLALGFSFLSSVGQGAEGIFIEEINLSKIEKNSKIAVLKKFKKVSLNKKKDECLKLSKSALTQFPLIKGWTLLTYSRCLQQSELSDSEMKFFLAKVDAELNDQRSLPWKKELSDNSVNLRLKWTELLLKSHSALVWDQIRYLQSHSDLISKEQLAMSYFWAADMAAFAKNNDAALSFLDQSIQIKETKLATERLKQLRFGLNIKVPTEVIDSTKIEFNSEGEAKFEDRFKNATKQSEYVNLVEDCISYLNEYPNGRRAKWANDKVLEIYNLISDKSKDEKMLPMLNRILSLMQKADVARVTEWSRALHRKSDYNGSLALAEKVIALKGRGQEEGLMLYIAGRSAQLAGDYNRAQKYFENYIEFHSGLEDINEVYFRLALVHFRKGYFSSAVASLEKLLQQKNIDRYELNAHYWLYRSLEALKNPRAAAEREVILKKYPFSYYGLKVRNEQNGFLDWPAERNADVEKTKKIYLTADQKDSFERLKILVAAEMSDEASAEMANFISTTDIPTKLILAQWMVLAKAFKPAIILMNQAVDYSDEAKSLDIYRKFFPAEFLEKIKTESSLRKIDSVLVRSLIRQESAYQVRAVSTSQALGLMQLIPATAQEVSTELGLSSVSIPEDVLTPDINIQLGTLYIAKMIRQFNGNVPLGLAAYNAGPVRMKLFVAARDEVKKQTTEFSTDPANELWFDELPWTETSFYVKAILRNILIYKMIEKSDAPSPDQRQVQLSRVFWQELVLP